VYGFLMGVMAVMWDGFYWEFSEWRFGGVIEVDDRLGSFCLLSGAERYGALQSPAPH